MNILYVHAIGRKKFGGGEKWVIMSGCGLKDMGHRVIICGRPRSKLLCAAAGKGLETIAMNVISDISIYHVVKLARIIKKQRIDVVIARERELGIAGLAARLSGKPLVLSRHGLALRSSVRKHVWLLNQFADGIITNTGTTVKYYEERGFFKKHFTELIYNGIEPDNNSEPFCYKQLFPKKKIILSVGRLAVQKGFYYLIDAMELLNREYDDLQLVILGDGKLRRKLQAYARKKGVFDMIHFCGFVNDVAPFFKGCDLFVLPSLYEGMPNAAMEAMVHGKPVVLTNVNGASELIPDISKGMLIPPRDSRAIVDAVKTYIYNTTLSKHTGDNARQYVMEHFALDKMIERLNSHIEKRLMCKKKFDVAPLKNAP